MVDHHTARPRSAGAADEARAPLRVVLHDYAGHPFQVQLSRELARRGHETLHLHCAGYVTGKGALSRRADDPDTFSVDEVPIGGFFDKYSPLRRLQQEHAYGQTLSRRVLSLRPDIVISSNNPLFSQRILVRACTQGQIPFVFWQQDVYSVAMRQELEKRLPIAGRLVGDRLVALERRLAHRSAALVAISEDFRPVLARWGLPPAKVHVVENWAPLDELPELERDNRFAREHGLADKRVLLYSGTLGLKHDPELLVRLAVRFRREDDVRVVVVSEGMGADYLRTRTHELGLQNLVLLGFQPYARLPEVLASGDVLVAILEPDAGVFSVPSKVLSYHCAGRPLLAALPRENLAARIIARNGSGLAVEPADRDGFVDAAERLLGEGRLRRELGRNARAYAKRTFDIRAIGDRFESILGGVANAQAQYAAHAA